MTAPARGAWCAIAQLMYVRPGGRAKGDAGVGARAVLCYNICNQYKNQILFHCFDNNGGIDMQKISMTDLCGEQRDLADCIGIDAYNALVSSYGGSNIYVYKPDTLTRRARDNAIRADFSAGKTVHTIVATYKMSERTVRKIIRDLAAARRRHTRLAGGGTQK